LSRILSASSTSSTASMTTSKSATTTLDDSAAPQSPPGKETKNGTTNDSTSAMTGSEITENSKSSKKILVGVRHGTSTANEYMSQPGRCWGDATFYDDVQYLDAPLSALAGHQQVGELAASFGVTLQSLLCDDSGPHQQERSSDESASGVRTEPNPAAAAAAVELVVVSPLTRCLETWLYGVRPALSLSSATSTPGTTATTPTIVLPLATERVYTSSDTGGRLSLQQLQSQFSQPELDWSYMPTATATTMSTSATTTTDTTSTTSTIPSNAEADESLPWWYTGKSDNYPPPSVSDITRSDKSDTSSSQQQQEQQQQPEQEQDSLEWRPHGQGQFYACPGEPQDVFEQRMTQLAAWLRQRPETCIVLVTHWGVLHYLSGEQNVENCGVVRIDSLGNE
jgi:broad specificity phosphatase PhoE